MSCDRYHLSHEEREVLNRAKAWAREVVADPERDGHLTWKDRMLLLSVSRLCESEGAKVDPAPLTPEERGWLRVLARGTLPVVAGSKAWALCLGLARRRLVRVYARGPFLRLTARGRGEIASSEMSP